MLQLHAMAIGYIALAAAGPVRSISCFVSNPREVDTIPILQLAAARGMITALPHIAERGGTMRFLRWQPGDSLVTGTYDIPQPQDDAPEIAPDVIFAPLAGFDRQGNRIGQGGGFYDRAFAAHPDARRVGLAWSVQEMEALPVDSWDQRLHAIITERERIDIP